MGWNGSGVVNRTDGIRSGTQVWQDARDAGVNILAADHDTHDEDLADAIENTVALDGQNTTTTDNAILRFDAGNSSFEGVTISASEIVGRGATGDVRSLSAATARKILGMGATAVPTNDQALFYSSAASEYTQRTGDAARKLLNLGTATPTNETFLAYSSASSQYTQRTSGAARKALNLGTASPTNGSFLVYASASSQYTQKQAYEEDRIELGGDFNAGEEVVIVRSGNIVTITQANFLSHTSSSNPASSAGVIPAKFRPSSEIRNCVDANTSYNITVVVNASGTLSINYVDWTGSLTAQTGAGGVSISYVLEGNVT